MAVREVLQLGHPDLRVVAASIADPTAREIAALTHDLADTVVHWRSTTGYGRAITAPQIGVPLRVILFQLPGEKPWPMVNPEILEQSEETIVVWDACLSFLFLFCQVERHKEITVRYQDLSGVYHTLHAGADRDLAELLQHEIDHLDGILAIDRMTSVQTLTSREEFEHRYRGDSPYAIGGASDTLSQQEVDTS